MSEYEVSWTALLAVITIVGVILTITKPIIQLTSTLTELNSRLDKLETDIDKFTINNRQEHRHLHDRIDHVENDLNDVKEQVNILQYKEGD